MGGPNELRDERAGTAAVALPLGRGMAAIAVRLRLRQRDRADERGDSVCERAVDCDAAMRPMLLGNFTATSCIGKGAAATLGSLLEQRSGLGRCGFETVDIETHIGAVAGGG